MINYLLYLIWFLYFSKICIITTWSSEFQYFVFITTQIIFFFIFSYLFYLVVVSTSLKWLASFKNSFQMSFGLLQRQTKLPYFHFDIFLVCTMPSTSKFIKNEINKYFYTISDFSDYRFYCKRNISFELNEQLKQNSRCAPHWSERFFEEGAALPR